MIHSKQFIACVVSCFLASMSVGGSAVADNYRIDPGHSTTLFRVKHMNTSNFWGRFNGIAGKLVLDDPSSAVEVTIKADNVDTNNQQRDTHLKGPDFFNSKQFPEITFKSSAVKKVDDKTYDVDGTLTLHGVSKPLKLQLVRTGAGKDPRGGNIAGFETTFDIKRTDFGMTYSTEGVSDDVRLVIGIEAAKQ